VSVLIKEIGSKETEIQSQFLAQKATKTNWYSKYDLYGHDIWDEKYVPMFCRNLLPLLYSSRVNQAGTKWYAM